MYAVTVMFTGKGECLETALEAFDHQKSLQFLDLHVNQLLMQHIFNQVTTTCCYAYTVSAVRVWNTMINDSMRLSRRC